MLIIWVIKNFAFTEHRRLCSKAVQKKKWCHRQTFHRKYVIMYCWAAHFKQVKSQTTILQ